MNFRKEFEENASLIAACFVLFCYLLISGSDKVTDRGLLHVEVVALLVPVSAFYSAHTIIRLASQLLPALGWWLHGSLRWTSWWIVHVMVAFLVTGIASSSVHDVPDRLLITLSLGISSLLLMWHIIRDYAVDRRRFGSIAKAGRKLYPSGLKRR